MKRNLTLLISALIISIGSLSAQTARVQVIHNSADNAAEMVDVYLDSDILLDDFKFRSATPFVDLPAGSDIELAIAPYTSSSASEALATFSYNLEEDETYIIVANGIVSSSGYSPSTSFDLHVYAMGRETASQDGNTDVLVFHGATDAPTVDVAETAVPAGTIVNDLAYADFDGYLELATSDYVLEVQDETGTVTVASFDAPLSTLGLENQALVVLASGFLNPAGNSNGAAFGLYVALPSGGDLVALPVSMARAQFMHNSADKAAELVNVFVDGKMLIHDLKFRSSTLFLDLPAGVESEIAIVPSGKFSADDAVATFTRKFKSGKDYIAIVNGIVSPSGYSPASPLDLYLFEDGRIPATKFGNTDVLVFHGSTDAPTVDVYESSVPAGTIVNDISYGKFTGYLELATADYNLEVRDQSGSSTVARYDAPLSTLGLENQALVVLASGFLNPSANDDGEEFGLYAALSSGGDFVKLPASSAIARAQIIHNSADAAASMVDVYVNDALIADDFEFRSSTPFVDLPAGINIEVVIAPSTSSSSDDGIATFNYNLDSGETYIIVANGIVSSSGYSPATAFDLHVYAMGREMATQDGNTDVLVFHGATDAPTVDVAETAVPAGTIVNDLAYADFAGYLELATSDYVLEVQDETGSVTVASFDAPLSTLGLENQALVVLASGFLNPANNSDGEAFGLYVALPSGGDLVALPSSMARAQIVHNSADAAAEMVDVYLDGALIANDFMFRTATPFVDLPAGVEIEVAIAPSTSTSANEAIATFNYQLQSGGTYIIVANGIVSSEGYSPSTPFDLHVYAMGREMASQNGFTDVLVFHGATDAPVVDVAETSIPAGTLVNDLAYADFAGYLELLTADYVLEVQDETGSVTVASYDAPLQTLGLENQALVVLASGFLTPGNNSDGEAFGLYVALPSGGDLVALPASKARAQIIHNSADAAAEMVDVYLNGAMIADDFMFRTATPFVDLPAGVETEVAIAPSGSTSADDAIAYFNYNLASGKTYIIVANGMVSASGYTPATAFDLHVYAMGREEASSEGNTDVLVFHGATDAPTVDVAETMVPAGTIVDNLAYADFAGYLELSTMDYKLEIQDETGETTVAAYSAPLMTLGLEGQALVVLASGFLNPAENSNGPSFGLYVALASGGDLVELPIATSTNQIEISALKFKSYPNPVTDYLTIELGDSDINDAEISIYNTTGQLMDRQKYEIFGQKISYNANILKSGQYIIVVVTDGIANSSLIEIVR